MIDTRVRHLVIVRAWQRCERCGGWLDVAAGMYSLQHRRARGMGGSRLTVANAAVNLAALCGSATTGCHGWIEAHPLEALEDGWRVRQGDDPAATPIKHHEHGLVLLTPDYTYQEIAA